MPRLPIPPAAGMPTPEELATSIWKPEAFIDIKAPTYRTTPLTEEREWKESVTSYRGVKNGIYWGASNLLPKALDDARNCRSAPYTPIYKSCADFMCSYLKHPVFYAVDDEYEETCTKAWPYICGGRCCDLYSLRDIRRSKELSAQAEAEGWEEADYCTHNDCCGRLTRKTGRKLIKWYQDSRGRERYWSEPEYKRESDRFYNG